MDLYTYSVNMICLVLKSTDPARICEGVIIQEQGLPSCMGLGPVSFKSKRNVQHLASPTRLRLHSSSRARVVISSRFKTSWTCQPLD